MATGLFSSITGQWWQPLFTANAEQWLQAAGFALGVVLMVLALRSLVVYAVVLSRSYCEQRRLRARLTEGRVKEREAPVCAGVIPEGYHDAAIAAENQNPETTWQALGQLDVLVVSARLRQEHPQTVAFVLSKLGSAESAAILSLFEEPFALEVLLRLTSMGYIRQEIEEIVEDVMQREILAVCSATGGKDSIAKVAAMLNHIGPPLTESYLKFLAVRDKSRADSVRVQLITFEDIEKIGQEGVKALLQVLDRRRLAVALKGATDMMRLVFLRVMPEPAAEGFMQEVHRLPPVTLRDVSAAQAEMVSALRELIAKGKIAW